MEECIFCKIVEGKIPSDKVAESENFLAFMDIAPISEGHTLVVPKKHSTNFLDMPEYLGNEFLEFAQRVGTAVVAGTGAEGFNIGLNNGKAAGQAVFHTHFHIIPRNSSDGLSNWTGKQVTPEQIKAMQGKIIQALK